jgi:hypothetical protein
MNRHDPLFALQFHALLEDGRTVQPLPDVVRARSLARARAAMTRPAAAIPTAPVSLVRRRRVVLTIAASVAFVLGAGLTAAALYGRAPRRLSPPSAANPSERPLLHDSRIDSPSSPVLETENTAFSTPQHADRATSARQSYAAELKLLARAQAAYANGSLSYALTLVAQHGRRFPNGRLAEEREALRVRALANAGRTEEADRAARAFAARFPRSVFLPRLGTESK